jgi:hypothetical protein
MKKALLILTILFQIIIIAQPVAASWYAGNARFSVYGVKADIHTPESAPSPCTGAGLSNWVSTAPNYDHPGWVQTGWLYIPESPYYITVATPYVELKTDNGTRSYYEYGTQSWDTYKNYKINWNGYWEVYIDGNLKLTTGGDYESPPVNVEVYSEVQSSSSNELDTFFDNVSYKNSGGSWTYFDQDHWLDNNDPYTIYDESYYYMYLCIGPN